MRSKTPGKSLVGEDGACAAWLLVQHADYHRDFQKSCLKLIDEAPEGEVELKHVAYLIDRTLVADGKKQRYGTQFGAGLVLKPVEDEKGLDNRRKAMGLAPLKEYIEMAQRGYGGFSKSKTKQHRVPEVHRNHTDFLGL